MDLINYDQDHNAPRSDLPPTMGQACVSAAHNLVTENQVSLEDSLLCSNTNKIPS